MYKVVPWVQRKGPAKTFTSYQLGFITRRQDSEAKTTEQGKSIPRKRDGECVVNEEKAWSKAWRK